RRRRLIELSPRPEGNVALARRICEASATADSAAKAIELAELALFTAQKVPGDPAGRARAEGLCWGFVANARRRAGDLGGAEAAFDQAWELWRAGESAPSKLLPEGRLCELEASLWREKKLRWGEGPL